MIRTRASAITLGTTFVGASLLSGLLAMPIAHADALDAIRSAVNGNRGGTPCPAYKYSGALEGAAQAYARSENVLDGQPGGYDGNTVAFLGSGDPQADAINSAYKRGAGGLISNCDYTEFGVGFIRHEDREVDVVTIVFGKPNAPKPVEKPAEQQPQTTPCEGSAPVPVGTPCPVKEVPPPSPDSITMSVAKAGAGKVDVKFTNSSDVAGSCDYVATPTSLDPFNVLPTVNKTVQVPAKGTGVIPGLTDPRPLASYHLEATCTGTVNGASVPLGSPQQDL